MRIVIVVGGVVTEVYVADENWRLIFPDGVPSETANVGDLYDGVAFTSPAAAGRSPAELLAYAAARRWVVETGGIVVSGVPVATDDRSKLLVLAAARLAYASESFTTPFKAADGSVHMLDAAQIIAINDAGSAHVQSSFVVFAELAAAIAAGTVTTVSEIDAAPWPANWTPAG